MCLLGPYRDYGPALACRFSLPAIIYTCSISMSSWSNGNLALLVFTFVEFCKSAEATVAEAQTIRSQEQNRLYKVTTLPHENSEFQVT
jgi:hypothetical protein